MVIIIIIVIIILLIIIIIIIIKAFIKAHLKWNDNFKRLLHFKWKVIRSSSLRSSHLRSMYILKNWDWVFSKKKSFKKQQSKKEILKKIYTIEVLRAIKAWPKRNY